MPFYNDLRPEAEIIEKGYARIFPTPMTVEEKIRAINGILALKDGLANGKPDPNGGPDIQAPISPRRTEHNLLISSWNIKEFGHTTQRLPEAYFYIAEIIASFDLVALQEIKTSLTDLKILMRILGSDWDYLVNDITSGNEGNSERSAYVYNTKRVRLNGTVGELMLWPEITAGSEITQLARTPYLTGFRAGWKDFALISLHLEPGSSESQKKRRSEEVRLLLRALEEKTKENWNSRLIVTGDFNFYERHDAACVQAFEDAGFFEVDGMKGVDTNASKTEIYDRMFIKADKFFRLATQNGKTVGGVFDPFQFVYLDGDEATYRSTMLQQYTGEGDLTVPSKLTSYYKHPWRKNQVSDHFPIWMELYIDDSAEFLESRKKKHEAD
ncbi:MAG: hypothetical protein CMK09_19020 [Ponticaulis sp.]|nr:hypothetical protein [Ponticaulis sp.]|tara:strand:- start:174055 stop:175206 length:1152 start_codon:yes stop_codon:yes gene_type:complete